MGHVIPSRRFVQINWLLFGLIVFFLVAWLMPPVRVLQDMVLMTLPVHMFAETFSIIVSMLVFAWSLVPALKCDPAILLFSPAPFLWLARWILHTPYPMQVCRISSHLAVSRRPFISG